jgi:nascent polypeptide-associated complex subunit alpha
MMRMMQRMGMKVEELQGVTEVLIKTTSKQIKIIDPSVSRVTVQGQATYQIVGGKLLEEPLATEAKTILPESDIKLVAEQSSVSIEEARRALEETQGDLAKAILLLAERKQGT